jgi:hypothetical protein
MFNYIPVRLIVDESQIDNYDLFSKSSYFAHAFLFKRDRIVALAVDHMKRSESLDIWKDIKPKGEEYEFELAVQLPFFLPRHKNANEYSVNIRGKQYIISNRHCEFIFGNRNDEYYLGHYLSKANLEKEVGIKVKQIIMSKTLLITKFKVKCISASRAIESNYENWLGGT